MAEFLGRPDELLFETLKPEPDSVLLPRPELSGPG